MSMMVFTTTESLAEAERLGRTLVEEKLAACVTILPGATSIYRWEDKLQETPEFQLLIKSRSGLWKRLHKRLKSLHACKVPELFAVKMQKADRQYADWLKANTRLIRVAGGARPNPAKAGRPAKPGDEKPAG
jgi:periplasmic divalent cation tolerance protein